MSRRYKFAFTVRLVVMTLATALNTQHPVHERNAMKKLVLVALVCLISAAFARPTINDGDFNYFDAKGVSYYQLAVTDGELVVTLGNSAWPGAIPHTFASIKREPRQELDRVFGPTAVVNIDEREEAAADRKVIIGNLRELAGMSDLGSGWAVTHDKLGLEEAIAAYTNWFTIAGLEVAAETGTNNVRPYTVSGDAYDSDLRVVFTRKGTGVRVYIGEL